MYACKRKEIILSTLIAKEYKRFEDIKHTKEDGTEYWSARELGPALDYIKWENFSKVIKRAMIACENSGHRVGIDFPEVRKIVDAGATSKPVIDYELSRYACYLIVMNGNPKKEIIALGQTYFAIQTRKQELNEKEYSELTEDEKRFYQRDLTRKGNYSLNIAARNAGVKNFDKFHNSVYKGLYNGETANDIAKRKKLRYREDILDNMGSDELIANLFRISQTEQKLKNENIKIENEANKTHYEVGKAIRNTIKKLGGTMPEKLSTPEKSLKALEKEKNDSKQFIDKK